MKCLQPIPDEKRPLTTPLEESKECGICGSDASQYGQPVWYKYGREFHIIEFWQCGGCETQGSIIRDRATGDVVRLSHLHTGNGYEYLQEGR